MLQVLGSWAYCFRVSRLEGDNHSGSQGEIESEDEVEEGDVDGEFMEESNMEYADDGNLLVIKQSLNSHAMVEDNQHENIFYTKVPLTRSCVTLFVGGEI